MDPRLRTQSSDYMRQWLGQPPTVEELQDLAEEGWWLMSIVSDPQKGSMGFGVWCYFRRGL